MCPICRPAGMRRIKQLPYRIVRCLSQKEIETSINPAFVCHEVEGTWVYVAGMGGGYEFNNNVFGILCADGTTKAKLIMRSYGSGQIIFEFVYPAR